MKKNNMYPERKGNIAWYRGCAHDCVYCGFKRTLRFQKCIKCQNFEPHAHLEVLKKRPPVTKEGEFLTMGLTGDICFASKEEMEAAIAYCEKWSDRTFLFQTKNPRVYLQHKFPDNVILDVTIESDIDYPVTLAPSVRLRHDIMTSSSIQSKNNKIWITVEPIMGFSGYFPSWLEEIHPEVVYIGYDSKNHTLTEPSLEQTKHLIERVGKFAEVRTKLLRKAHWEQ